MVNANTALVWHLHMFPLHLELLQTWEYLLLNHKLPSSMTHTQLWTPTKLTQLRCSNSTVVTMPWSIWASISPWPSLQSSRPSKWSLTHFNSSWTTLGFTIARQRWQSRLCQQFSTTESAIIQTKSRMTWTQMPMIASTRFRWLARRRQMPSWPLCKVSSLE